jgi:hypothetical protein
MTNFFLLTFWCCCCLTPVATRRLVYGDCARSPTPDAWLLLVCFLMSMCWADAGKRLICSPLFWPPGDFLFSPPATLFNRLCLTHCSSCLHIGCTLDRDTFVASYLVTCFTVHNFTPILAPHVCRHFSVTTLSHSHLA